MPSWTFYPATIGTVISMLALTRLARREHNSNHPRTLSELAAAEEHLLWEFRKILWLCGTLFAMTVYWFIMPRVSHPFFVAIAWSITYVGEMLLAMIPARGKTKVLHNILAESMGAGMLLLAAVFWRELPGSGASIELAVTTVMAVLGIMTIVDKQRFIFYELSFIYLSHCSIVIAAFALAAF